MMRIKEYYHSVNRSGRMVEIEEGVLKSSTNESSQGSKGSESR